MEGVILTDVCLNQSPAFSLSGHAHSLPGHAHSSISPSFSPPPPRNHAQSPRHAHQQPLSAAELLRSALGRRGLSGEGRGSSGEGRGSSGEGRGLSAEGRGLSSKPRPPSSRISKPPKRTTEESIKENGKILKENGESSKENGESPKENGESFIENEERPSDEEKGNGSFQVSNSVAKSFLDRLLTFVTLPTTRSTMVSYTEWRRAIMGSPRQAEGDKEPHLTSNDPEVTSVAPCDSDDTFHDPEMTSVNSVDSNDLSRDPLTQSDPDGNPGSSTMTPNLSPRLELTSKQVTGWKGTPEQVTTSERTPEQVTTSERTPQLTLKTDQMTPVSKADSLTPLLGFERSSQVKSYCSVDQLYSNRLQAERERAESIRGAKSLLDIQRERERAEQNPARYMEDLKVLHNIYRRELVSQLLYIEGGQIFIRRGGASEPRPLRPVIGSPSRDVIKADPRHWESKQKLLNKVGCF
ncbi:uncharacterized protein LOC122243995 [Penaeus japonicus]|uniref:uncharacterized protein LOC122243995 n=1 Tax=Penaeus japonicus TaxID=27405 RepID=UPI001C71107E|nr:uncharacterized protein LOC122243995 [Penaeus japonicus]